jgi:IS5 family transposase
LGFRFWLVCDSLGNDVRWGARWQSHGTIVRRTCLRPALEDIIDLGHPLVRLARAIDWGFLDGRFAGVCTAGAGQPPLPTRLVAGLFILKHMHDLSDEVLCARWLENPYYQFFAVN